MLSSSVQCPSSVLFSVSVMYCSLFSSPWTLSCPVPLSCPVSCLLMYNVPVCTVPTVQCPCPVCPVSQSCLYCAHCPVSLFCLYRAHNPVSLSCLYCAQCTVSLSCLYRAHNPVSLSVFPMSSVPVLFQLSLLCPLYRFPVLWRQVSLSAT